MHNEGGGGRMKLSTYLRGQCAAKKRRYRQGGYAWPIESLQRAE